MIQITKKPTRRDLLLVVTELQGLIGKAMTRHANDRDPDGYEKGQKLLEQAHALCIQARTFDPPTDAEPPARRYAKHGTHASTQVRKESREG